MAFVAAPAGTRATSTGATSVVSTFPHCARRPRSPLVSNRQQRQPSRPARWQPSMQIPPASTPPAESGDGIDSDEPPADSSSSSSSPASIPSSLPDACSQACAAIETALAAGNTRLFVEIDLTNGDETYTVLKSTLPALRALLPGLAQGGRVRVLFPDSGTAALVRRDWVADAEAAASGIGAASASASASASAAAPVAVDWLDEDQFVLGSVEDRTIVDEGDAVIVCVCPRAGETAALQRLSEAANDIPVLVMNPDLVDMGVTGLSLNARRLQESLINNFDTAYYLRVFPWGVLLRAWPGPWGVWVDEPGSAIGFRLVSQLETRPSTDTLSDILDEDTRAAGGEVPGGIGAVLAGFKRFIDVYTKG